MSSTTNQSPVFDHLPSLMTNEKTVSGGNSPKLENFEVIIRGPGARLGPVPGIPLLMSDYEDYYLINDLVPDLPFSMYGIGYLRLLSNQISSPRLSIIDV